MQLAVLADYAGYSILWTIFIVSAFKLCCMLRKVSHTSSGRPLDEVARRDKRLEDEIKVDSEKFHELMGDATLNIIEAWNFRYACINGENLFKKRAVLIIVPGLDLIDDQAFHWIYKREFYYMINHVFIKVQIIKFLVMTIAAIVFYMMINLSFLSSVMGVLVTGLFLESLCRHIVENRADSFAKEHSSIEELQGGVRFLTAAHRENKKVPLIQRMFQCIMQPTYHFRMNRLRRALAKANALYSVEEEKVAALRSLFEKNNQEELAFIEAKKQQVLRWIDADED